MNWFANLRTQNKLFLFVILITIMAGAALGWSVYSVLLLQSEIEQAEKQINDMKAIQANAQYILWADRDSRSYLLLGSEDYRGSYEVFVTQVNSDLRARLLNEQNDQQRLSFDRLQKMLRSYRTTMDQTLQSGALVLSDEDEERLDSIDVSDDQLLDLMSEVDQIQYRQQAELQRLLTQSHQLVRRILTVSIIALIAMTLLFTWVANRINLITEPLQRITNAVVAFENNLFKPNMLDAYTDRKDEMGLLARSFTNMAAAINQSVAAKDAFIRSTARFIPQQYLEFLNKPSVLDIRLGDHVSAEMAVMFSDIRGFTTASEHMSAEENFAFINRFMQMVSPIVEENNGFIVKFLGDGMMAIFPYSVDDAVRTAIEKQQRIQALNAELEKSGLPPLFVGIGIHSGHMMVGMIGEEKRLQGDAFSDNVNLTSRVEGLTRFYGVSVILTLEAMTRLENRSHCLHRSLGKVRVKGRQAPLELFEIFEGDPDDLRTLKHETRSTHEQGMQYYQRGDFSQAQKCFLSVLERNPRDQLASFYLTRCTRRLAEGVPPDWDGVEVHTEK